MNPLKKYLRTKQVNKQMDSAHVPARVTSLEQLSVAEFTGE